jgi:4-hydroxybenzoate polyprenyltransferase
MTLVYRVFRKIIDLAFLTRPPLLCVSCTFFFAGAASSQGNGLGLYDPSLMYRTLANFLGFVLVVASAFVLNQMTDIRGDRINRKSFILPSRVVTLPESIVFLVAIYAAAILFGFHLGGPLRYLIWSGLGLGLAYSAPPVRLKARPIWDALANVIGFGIIGFVMGWLSFLDLDVRALLHSLPYVLAMAAIFLNTCIPDEEGDRLVGDRTSCVVFGRKAVSRSAALILVLSAVSGAVLDEMPSWLASTGSLPAFIAVAANPTDRSSVLASQFAARLLFVLVASQAPALGVLGVAIYVASRLYYDRRFGFGYPCLAGVAKGEAADR